MIFEISTNIPQPLMAQRFEGDTISPSFMELDELSRIDNIEKRVILVKSGDDIEACAICNIEKRRHHGLTVKVYALFGYLVHDYCRLFCKSKSAMEMLKNAAIKDAKEHGCDLIVWSNIPAELVPEGSLPVKSDIKLFTVSENQGWDRFYKSKHVKYLLNKVKKLDGEYQCTVIDGYVPDDLMEQFADFHIKRWRFAGSSSPFSTNVHRSSEYRCHPLNKHYLRILSGNELIACHYGMRYGDTLLFHTPIINPKYLSLSPMKLILAETAKYCEENGLRSIDFGHGDEAYKEGYCTLPRYTCDYERAVSIKGLIAKTIGKVPKDWLSWPMRQMRKLFSRQSNIIITKRVRIKSASDSRYIVRLIDNWIDFCDFSNEYGLQLYKEDFDRFRLNKSTTFIGLIENNKCISSAWISNASGEEADVKTTPIVSDLNFGSSDSLKQLLVNIPIKSDNGVIELHANQNIFDVINRDANNNLQIC